MKKYHYFLIALLLCAASTYAQLGIKAGVNMANEIKTFNQQAVTNAFSTNNLTGYQIGLVYQAMPKNSGLGCEFGALISQKGCTFSDSTNIIKQGYRELNYLEVPFNVRYHLMIGLIGIYGTAGVYGGYALNAKTVDEITNDIHDQDFEDLSEHIDYGYNLGAGIELFKKIQFGANWSHGLKNTASLSAGIPMPKEAKNRVFSINLVYLF